MTDPNQVSFPEPKISVNIEPVQNHGVSEESNLASGGPTAVYDFNIRSMMTAKSPVSSPIYRSVPAPGRTIKIPGEGNQMDNVYQPYSPQKKTVQMNTPWEYADRFKSKPTGRPHIVGFDGMTLLENGLQECRGLSGFFPPVKLRVSTPSVSEDTGRSTSHSARSTRSRKSNTKTPPLILELVPEHQANEIMRSSQSARKASSTARKYSGGSVSSRTSHFTNKTQPLVYPHIQEGFQYNSLTELPKPKLMVSRDNPWVYRYKVKKNMNELSKIMASKAPKKVDFTIKHE